MLLLIALQKLAASSIAAIRSALTKRRSKMVEVAEQARTPLPAPVGADEDDTLDDRARADEEAWGKVLAELMDGEIARIDELLALAEPIEREQKIDRLIDLIIGELPPDEPVLFFTEYKATQALVVDALHDRFGHGCSAFINGDERLNDVDLADGSRGTKSWSRDAAAEAFNQGDVRFLVSTEAAGEGIDLQERCATLVHVDMPWNPMRLHQRVGRLSRYGQTRPVKVFILRNPDTVEARIWDLLNAKLERIQRALNEAMDEQEDISQLVIGMTGAGAFEKMFADGQTQSREGLDQWFDREGATIGGEDLVDKVKAMFGNVARFDFAEVGRNLPQVDLPDLERFFSLVMESKGRRIFRREDGLDVLTPESWVDEDYAMQDRYKGLLLDRNAPLGSQEGPTRLIGVGHTLFDRALREGESLQGVLAYCVRLSQPILIASVEDEVTGQDHSVTRIIIAATRVDDDSDIHVMRDWELLQLLNTLGRSDHSIPPALPDDKLKALEADLLSAMAEDLSSIAEMMTRPSLRSEIMLVPDFEPPRNAGQ